MGVWNNIKSTISSAITGISGIVSSGFSAISGVAIGIFNGMKDRILGVFNGIKSGIKSVLNVGVDLVNGFVGKINGVIRTANKVPGVDIGKISSVPKFARGGIATRPSIFGEAGPEMAIPLRRKSARSKMLLEQTVELYMETL